MRLAVTAGTRPEIIKLSSVIRALIQNKLDFTFIHSGQHYDYNLSRQFIEELDLPLPDYGFRLQDSPPVDQISGTIVNASRSFQKEGCDSVLVQGDTNSTLANSLAAIKIGLPVGHVEAGLRSYDKRMPEEHNRRMVDHVAEYLFAPTEEARENLRGERVLGRIFVTGNTVIDAVMHNLPLAVEKSTILEDIRFQEYALATIHRVENVDDKSVLGSFVEAFLSSPIPIVLSLHPRTMKRMREYGFYDKIQSCKHLHVLPAVGYFDFLVLMKNCRFLLTDSGGLQEEATAPNIQKRVLVLRISTERHESVRAGYSEVVGTERDSIIQAIKKEMTVKPVFKDSPYGDGNAGEKIVDILVETLS